MRSRVQILILEWILERIAFTVKQSSVHVDYLQCSEFLSFIRSELIFINAHQFTCARYMPATIANLCCDILQVGNDEPAILDCLLTLINVQVLSVIARSSTLKFCPPTRQRFCPSSLITSLSCQRCRSF